MKRDWDLVRAILLKIEEGEETRFDELVSEEDEQRPVYAYHTKLLIHEGFLTGLEAPSMDGPDWLDLELSWKGHEFLDTLRDKGVWEKTKKAASAAGGKSLQILLDVGKAIVIEGAKAELKKMGMG